ncbi:MAG: hypothetical protein A2Y33_12900 [Spirochaetes bacterium GWF1_51_8]|nr:MAG: hypothetical protein A2Y33_12900 [Spirochaetes bacterium GWF1_51_8]
MGKLLIISVICLFSANALFAETVSIENDYVFIGVHDKTSRFFMSTKEGDPKTVNDNNKKILPDKTPPTSITVINIDGFITIYGSTDGTYYFRATNDNGKIITDWMIRGLVIRQILEIVDGPTTLLPDTMLVSYSIENNSGQAKKVGVEIILDMYLGDKDGVPCSIEGKLVDKETQFTGESIPDLWYTLDDANKANVRVQGTLKHPLIAVSPDKVIFTVWPRLFDNLWDIEANNSAFPKGKFDNAVAVFFENKTIEPKEKAVFSTMYGLFGANVFSADDLITKVTCDSTIKKYPFPMKLEVQNKSGRELDLINVKLMLPDGLKLSSKSKTKASMDVKKLGIDKSAVFEYMIDQVSPAQDAQTLDIGIAINGKLDTITVDKVVNQGVTLAAAEAPAKEPEKDTAYYMTLMNGDWVTVSQFGYNSSKLTPAIKAELDQAAEVFQQIPVGKGIKIQISGYTDADGSEKLNLKLGMARAKAVYDYLTKVKKLPKSLFVLESGGEADPVSGNDADDGMAENRRVEFKLIMGE